MSLHMELNRTYGTCRIACFIWRHTSSIVQIRAARRQKLQLHAVHRISTCAAARRRLSSDLPEPFMRPWNSTNIGKGAISLEEPLVQRDQAEHDGLGVRSRVRVDLTPFLSRASATYRLVLHTCRVAGPHPLLYQRPQLLAEPRAACLLSSRAVPSEPSFPSCAAGSGVHLRHVLYAGTVANDIAQVLCRQVHRLFYFFLTAFRVSPEILGGRPERVRVCRPAVPSFRYRLCH